MSFLLAGVYGILLSLCDLNDAVYPEWTVYLVAAVVSGVLWYFRFYQRKLFFRAAMAVFLTELLYVFLLRKRLLDQLLQIADRFTGEGGGNALAVAEVSLAAAMLIPTAMFFLEIVLKKHWIFFLLTEGMLLLFPVFGLNMGFAQVILLALFQISFWVLRISDGGENGLTASATGQVFFPGVEIGVLAAAFAVVMLLLIQPVSRYAPALYDFVYRAEGVVYRSLDVWSGHAAEPVSGGAVSRGNNYRSESARLEVTVSQAPSQTVYLRGFEGGAYMGGEWGQSLDGELFVDMAETLDWQQWGYMISGMYQTMYFVMNSAMQNNSAEPILMDIRHLNGIYRDLCG